MRGMAIIDSCGSQCNINNPIVHCVLLAARVAASLDQLCLTSGRRQGGREMLLWGPFNFPF